MNSIGYHFVVGILWVYTLQTEYTRVVADGPKCKDIYITSDKISGTSSLPNALSKNIYSPPFKGKICISHYPETWDAAYRVCQYNSSYLLSLNVFNLNYSDIRSIIGNIDVLHIGIRRQNGIFNWIGLKPEMFRTGIRQSDWGWQWDDGEPQNNHCVAVNVTTGKLLTVSCSDSLQNFICAGKDEFDMTSKLCNTEWKYSHFSKHCLRESSVYSSQRDAVNFCSSLSGRLMSKSTFLASFPELRFEYGRSREDSRVWLDTPDTRSNICSLGMRDSNGTIVGSMNCAARLKFICEQDPFDIDIKVKMNKKNENDYSFSNTILVCKVSINGSKWASADHNVWWRNGEILRGNGYSLIFGYYSGIDDVIMEQGRYLCEVRIPGYPDYVSSVADELYDMNVSTILMVIESSDIPYDPVKYDQSKPDYERKFHETVKMQFSLITAKFVEKFPEFPVPQWQLINASKTDNFTTLKANVFLNHKDKKRPKNEREDIFNPVWMFLSSLCKKGIGQWKLRQYDIASVGMCFTESTKTILTDVIWKQTYHSKHATSSPMCLSDDWKILTRSCNGGYGIGSKWLPFDQKECRRLNKELEDPDHHHCQPGYQRWNYSTCIQIYSKPANWSEAVAECGRSLGFLFTPRVPRNISLFQNFNSSFKIFEKLGEMWLGGHRENGVIQWMAFEPGPVELDKPSVVEWEEKDDLEANCVSGIVGNDKIVIQNKPCTEKKPFACMHNNPEGKLYSTSECRENWYGSPWLDVCYFIQNKYNTWDEAHRSCESYTPDGTLAVLISPEENDLLKNHVLNYFKFSKNSYDRWWIGLEIINNYFRWLNSAADTSEITYVDWDLDAQYNFPSNAVAFKKKNDNTIKWLPLNQTTKLPSICQARTVTGTTWCHVSVRVDKIFKTDIYTCEVGHAIYDSVTWYKDGIAISGSRGLVKVDTKELHLVDLFNNSVFPLKEFYHLQGYYWCEVQQKDPFLSVTSNNVLFIEKSYWTFVGYFIATKLEGHYNIGQKKFWNVAEEIGKFLNTTLDSSLATDTYIAELLKVEKGNKVRFYIYFRHSGKRTNVLSKMKQIKKIKEHIAKQLNKYGKTTEKYGIVPESLLLMTTDECFREETIIAGKSLHWETTPAGKSAVSSEICINENGDPVIRRCVGNFTYGVHWDPLDSLGFSESCSGEESNLTLTLKILSKKELNSSNMMNISETLETLTRNSDGLDGIDIHYIATTLENIANEKKYSGMAINSVTATVNNVLAVQKEIMKNVQRTNASLRIVASLETVLKDSKQMHMITKSNIAVMSYPLKRKDSEKITGFVLLNNRDDGFHINDVVPISNDTPVPYSKVSAGIWLPLDIVEEKIGPNSNINFVLYRNATLFVTPPHIQKTEAIISPVISAFFSGGAVHLFSPRIQLAFKTVQVEKEIPDSKKCVYWEQNMNDKQGGWSTEGCRKPMQKSGHTVCYCDHLTSFAVLVDLYGDDESDNIEESAHGIALDIITYIGCTLSIFGLLLTIITFTVFKKLRNGAVSQVLCNLSVSLLLSLIVFMVGINQTHWKPGCMLVAALLHYLLMVAFAWMLVEAILQYLRLVKVIGTYIPRFILKSAICAWGIPLLIVISILAVDYELYYSRKNYCWLHREAFYYGFLLPVALIMTCNIIIFAVIIHSITRGRKKGLGINQSEKKLAIARLRAACCILFLLGLSWSFGFLAISDARLAFKYLFSIFTTLQGFFIFIFHVIQQKKTRNLWYSYIFHKKDSQIQTFTRDTSTFVKDSTVSRNK